MTASSRGFAATLAAVALAFAWVARGYAEHYRIPPGAAICIYVAFLTQLAIALFPAFCKSRDYARWVMICCLPYLLYAMGTGDFSWAAFGKLLCVAIVPVSLYRSFPGGNLRALNWQDGLIAIFLIAGVLSGQLRGIWTKPVNLDFMGRLFLIGVASWTWTFVRPVPSLGYHFHLSFALLKQSVLNFGWFALIALPVSLATHFTRWNPRWHGAEPFLVDYLEIFLFIALLEELFFRGFLQSLLSHSLDSRFQGQLAVSLLFGLFHIFHAPFPNWRYVALASVAGWFYGSAFRKSGSLLASSLTHAAVDTVWRTFLSAR